MFHSTTSEPKTKPSYLKAFLLRIKEGLIYAKQLRDFLLKHPLLVIELGFDLQLDFTADYGFDVERTLPTRYWFGEKLRQLDRTLLTDLLAATVAALGQEINPPLPGNDWSELVAALYVEAQDWLMKKR